MRKEISNFLYKAIDDFEGGFNERQSQSIFGIIKGGAVSLFGAFEELKKEVPM